MTNIAEIKKTDPLKFLEVLPYHLVEKTGNMFGLANAVADSKKTISTILSEPVTIRRLLDGAVVFAVGYSIYKLKNRLFKKEV